MPEVAAIIVQDREGTVIGWSEGARALLGYSEDEALGRTLEVLCQPVASANGSGVELTKKHGGRLRMLRTETSLRDARRAPIGLVLTLTPHPASAITERATSDALGRGERVAELPTLASLRQLIMYAPQGCMLLDAEAQVVFANAVLERMFGYETDGLVGLTVESLVPADVRRAHVVEIQNYLQTPSFRLLVDPVIARRQDGSLFPTQVGLGPVHCAGARYTLVNVLDVTAHKRLEQVQRESEARFRQLLQALPQMAWTCDPSGAIDFLSTRWEHYIGFSADELLATPLDEHVHPQDRPRLEQAWQSAREGGNNLQVELRLRRNDGAYRWFDTRASPLRDGFGRIVKWVGASTDVHEAVETRAALQHEQQLLQRIVETAPGAFCSFRIAADGTITMPFASRRIEQVLGFSASEIARDATPLSTRVHADDLPHVRASLVHSSQTGTAWHCEYRYRHPRHGEVWIEGQSLPTREPDGATQWFGFLRDVSERKRSEESLRATQAQLVAALEAGGMGIWSWDTDRDSVWLDDALLRLLGRRREELGGGLDDMLSVVHPDDVERVREAVQGLVSSASERVFECRIVDVSGNTRFLAVRGRSERDEAGRVHKITALNIDVTAQHRAAEARLRSQKLEALGTLAGGIAHDFNNILQAITGNTALALRALERTHRARRFLGEVAAASARASDLVRRILTFSRPGEQRLEVIALQPVIAEALRLVRATLPAQIEIRQELGESPLHILADGTQVHQIVVNLATNSAHAIGSRNGTITVQVETARLEAAEAEAASLPPGVYAVLEVGDNGSGMAPETLARIFDPFFTTKPVGQGTGLGLSVVHGLAKSLGGAVSVDSEIGRGTRFRLHFPLVDAPATRSDEPAPLREAAGQRILFVDDEDVLVVLGTHILDALGYRAEGFQRPREALDAFAADPSRFDAVVTDLSMPGLSGFELAKQLCAIRADLPVIMMSGFVGPDEIEAAARIGVRELLLKPVSIEQLGIALAKVFAS